MKFKAAVLTQLNAPLEIMELEVPQLKKGQVLVKVVYTGLCRSQLNEVQGKKGPDPYLPHVLGHEGSGIVQEVGEGVTKVKPGDHVILTWLKGNGLELMGTTYQCGDKGINSGPISTFMEYAVISENRLVALPKDINLKEASLFGCAIPTGAGMVYNDLNMQPGTSIAVFGTGGIGLSAICAARCKKAKMIIAVDVEDDKLKLAKEMGATHVLNSSKDNIVEAVAALTENKGVDYSIEAVGVKQVMETALAIVRPKGGICLIAGNTPKGVKIELDPFEFIKGKILTGSWGGGVHPDRDISLFAQEFHDNKIQLSKMISHELPLDRINEALDLLDQRKAARVLINFEK